MEDALGTALADHWSLTGVRVAALDGGMNSRTWAVRTPEASYVAKWVPQASTALLAAGALAARVAGRFGVPTGTPVGSRDGSDLVALGDGAMVLRTGVEDAADNQRGYERARRALLVEL